MNMNVQITQVRSKQKEVSWNFDFQRTERQAKNRESLRVDCFLNDRYQAHYMLVVFIWKTKALEGVHKVSYISKCDK